MRGAGNALSQATGTPTALTIVEVDGNKYHPDHAPATDDDEDVSEGDTAVAVAPVVTAPVVTAPVVNKQLTIEMLNECALVEEEHDHHQTACNLQPQHQFTTAMMFQRQSFVSGRLHRNRKALTGCV